MDRTILILGGYGNAGRALADILVEEGAVNLILAGRQLDKAQDAANLLNARHGTTRVVACQADAADPVSLRRALGGVDLLIVASSTIDHTLSVAEAALAAHVDYFDLLLSSRHKLAALKSLTRRIEQAGLCFITDGGYHPGVPAALVRYAARQFDELHFAVTAGVMRMPWAQYRFSESSITEFAQELVEFRPAVFRQGKWAESWTDSRVVDFGAPFRKLRCTAMRLEEMIDLPTRIPALQETGFFVAGFDRFTDYVTLPASLAVLKLAPGSARVVGRFFLWSASRFAKPPFGFVLQLEARGISAGMEKQVLLRLSHEDGYFLTAAPVAACVKQYLNGSIRIPGLHYQANLVEPVSFLFDMQRTGLRVSEEVLQC